MKKIISLLCISAAMFIFSAGVSAYELTWDYLARTTWGDGIRPDGDIYGNTAVWDYKYTPLNSTDYTQYEGFDNWYEPSNMWSYLPVPGVIGANNWLIVANNTIHPGNLNDVAVEFIAPMDGVYDITIQVNNSNGQFLNDADGQDIYLQKMSTVLDSVTNPVQGISLLSEQDVWLSAGESLFLRVNMRSNLNHDAILFQQFDITGTFPDPPIPEPASFILLALGVVGVIRTRLRR